MAVFLIFLLGLSGAVLKWIVEKLENPYLELVQFLGIGFGGIYASVVLARGCRRTWAERHKFKDLPPVRRVGAKLIRRTRGGLIASERQRVLVLRSVDDEASLTLAAGAIGNLVTSFIGMLVMLAVLIVVLGDSFQHFLGGFNPPQTRMSEILFNTVVYPVLITLFFVRTPYGREFLVPQPTIDIASHSAPDGPAVEAITLSRQQGAGGLRHSLYNHTEIPGAIVRWTSTRMAERDEPRPAVERTDDLLAPSAHDHQDATGTPAR